MYYVGEEGRCIMLGRKVGVVGVIGWVGSVAWMGGGGNSGSVEGAGSYSCIYQVQKAIFQICCHTNDLAGVKSFQQIDTNILHICPHWTLWLCLR